MNNSLYRPLKLQHNRVYRPFIGGKILDKWQSKATPKDGNIPEEWVASVINSRNNGVSNIEGLSKVSLEDKKFIFLKDIISQNPSLFLGKSLVDKYGAELPILVKVLDSYTRLLIQVHPNRKYAKEIFNSKYGKTECWYILDGRRVNGEDPYVLAGFKPGITKEIWKDLFEKQDIKGMENALHKFYVKPGDVFYIEGGIPHAAGSGCFFIEIQEPTDYTFRVEKKTPWGMKISENNIHQGVGIDNMLNCFNYNTHSRDKTLNKIYIKPSISNQDVNVKEISIIPKDFSPYFSMSKLEINNFFHMGASKSFIIALVLSGEGKLISKDGEINLTQSDEIFVPAGLKELLWVNTSNVNLDIVLCFPPSAD